MALTALDLFGVTTASDAESLRSMWARRAELSPADVAAVLSTYVTEYERDDTEEPTGGPLPAGVDGYSRGTRGGAR